MTKYVVLLVISLAILVANVTAIAQVGTSVEIGSETLDHKKVEGRKWTRLDFNALGDGEHTIRLTLDDDADIRFSIFKIKPNSNQRIATTSNSQNTLEWTGELKTSDEYFLGVWSASGSANFKASIEGTPLLITENPSDRTVYEGEDVVFSVQAKGVGPLTYQWFKNDLPIDGANAETLNIESVSLADHDAKYLVMVTDGTFVMTYASATLRVLKIPDPVAITSQPENQSVVEGETASFSITATGTGNLRYQWYADGELMNGEIADTLVINQVSVSDTWKAFSVVVTDDNGSIESGFATLQVVKNITLPVSSTNIGSGTLDHGRNLGPSITQHEFKSLTGGEHSIILSWDGDADLQFNVFEADGTRLKSIVNGVNPLVWIGDLKADQSYYISAWSKDGVADYTVIVQAIVSLSIERQPESITVSEGEDATFSVSASGSGNLGYQWFSDEVILTGETGDSMTVFSAATYEDGTRYSVEINDGIESIVSNTAILSVADKPDTIDLDPITVTAADTWNAAGDVHRIITVGDTIYVGGEFTRIYSPDGDSLSRDYIAAFNRFTGEPTNFAPEFDDDVRAFALSPDEKTLYVGGTFQKVDGQSRSRVVAFDVETGRMTDFKPPVINRALRALAVTEDKVYLGGLFTKVGDESRSFVAALDPDTGDFESNFNAKPDANVKALVAGPEGLWIGGAFKKINDRNQRGLGLVNLEYGTLESTDDVSHDVIDLAGTDDQLFISIGGPGGRAAAFDRISGSEQWTIASDGNFQAVAVTEGRFVYFGGHYEIVEGNRDADRMTRHDKMTGEMDVSWFPKINGIRSINAIEVREDGLYFGGDFTKVDNKPHEGFAVFKGLTK